MAHLVRRVALAVSASLLLVPAAAHASGAALIHDCIIHNDVIEGHYTLKDYEEALANPPADLKEYSDCLSVIRSQELALVAAEHRHPAHRGSGSTSGGGSSSGGGGSSSTKGGGSAPSPAAPAPPSAPATKAEQSALAQAKTSSAPPVRLGSRVLNPNELTGQGTGSLPTSLVVVLVAVALAALAAGAVTIGPRVSRRRAR